MQSQCEYSIRGAGRELEHSRVCWLSPVPPHWEKCPGPALGSGLCSTCRCLSFPIEVMGLLMLHPAECHHLVLAVVFDNPRERIKCSAF